MSKPKFKKYRPANGSEGDFFAMHWCEQCSKDDLENDIMCPIIGQTMALDVDDPHYPEQWRYGEDGRPMCTEFSLAK